MPPSKPFVVVQALLVLALVAACGGPDQEVPAPVGSTAAALGATHAASLDGPAIGGVVAQGEVKVDRYPPNDLELRVKDVNLPDGTVLTVSVAGYDVGTIRISGGKGAASLPVGFEVGRQSFVVLRLGATWILWTNFA